MRRAAVFLDRDGVLNELVVRDGQAASPRRLAEFRLVDGAASAVERMRRCGLAVFVASNQPDVARGHLARGELEAMMDFLRSQVTLDDVMVCVHDDADACECRKPRPGMLLALAQRWGVDLRCSFMVGDSWRDVGAGRSAGCRTVFIGGRDASLGDADVVVGSLAEATLAIEREAARTRWEPQ